MGTNIAQLSRLSDVAKKIAEPAANWAVEHIQIAMYDESPMDVGNIWIVVS